MRNRHAEADFTFAVKRQMRDVESLFGSDNVFVLSVDDKAKLPVGVTAVTKQAPLIMHVSYEIPLPDHYFVKATKHDLTPSVYAACEINPPSSRTDPEITYSCPTYIAIRSGKHDSSTAYIHVGDFDHLLGLSEFDKVVKHENAVKPIGTFFCDGGPDENPRFPKTLDVAIQHFKKSNLDTLLISTHAPDVSAYNQVRRRMAPLNKALSRIFLPYEALDSSRKTINTNLLHINTSKLLVKFWQRFGKKLFFTTSLLWLIMSKMLQKIL